MRSPNSQASAPVTWSDYRPRGRTPSPAWPYKRRQQRPLFRTSVPPPSSRFNIDYDVETAFNNPTSAVLTLLAVDAMGNWQRHHPGRTPSLSATATVLVRLPHHHNFTTTRPPPPQQQPPQPPPRRRATSTSIWSTPGFWRVRHLDVVAGLLLVAGIWYLCTRSGSSFSNICGPEKPPIRVRPVEECEDMGSRDNLIRQEAPRVSPNYREIAWGLDDNFEDGIGYNGRPASGIFFTRNSARRALPAPRVAY
ncbi:uncharacterized protein LOC112561507 [Pomacea canaliculata]|uniref:uncharacterized protein LOC112561507 n=1 Tax=Pomacea canaliculata TaxID=400727 RepID=UPI000D728B5D|nr:uncharacterized protein LOC112561507 [Pomacea canaliculata]